MIYENPLISGIGAVRVSVEASTPVILWIRQPSIHRSLLIGTPVLLMERGGRQVISSFGGTAQQVAQAMLIPGKGIASIGGQTIQMDDKS